MERKYDLRPATQEELDAFNKDYLELLTKHACSIKVIPMFVPTTEGKFVVDSQVQLFKNVELVPAPFVKDEGKGDSKKSKA